LLSSFTQEEISVALSQMSHLKAPGPDILSQLLSFKLVYYQY